MKWRIERWLWPRRDREGNLLAAGRWLLFTRDTDEADAEKTIRRLAENGGIARALSESGGMLARSDTFARWTGSGGGMDSER